MKTISKFLFFAFLLFFNSAFADLASDAEKLFSWGEQKYPSYFSIGKTEVVTKILNYKGYDWHYRYYPETKVFLAINELNKVYVLGGVFGKNLLYIGRLENLLDVPLLAKPSLTTTPTTIQDDSVEVEVNGKIGTTVFVNGVDSGKTIDSTGKVKVILDTSGDDEDKSFSITLKDSAGNESEVFSFIVTKQSNHALEFDGATKGQKHVADRLEIGELEGIAINPTDHFTVSFNIHFDSFSNDNPNLEDAWKNSQRGNQFIIGNYMGQPSGSGHFSSMLYELDGKLHFIFNNAQRRDKQVIFDFKTLNKDKLDYNIYASFDGTTAKIYIDGNEVADNYIGNIGGIANTAKWGAGNHYDGVLNDNRATGDSALDGKLDNILFYNRALSSEEVNKIQNGGEVTTGIVAKYDFEGSNPLADKTGNGHDASITNTPTIVEW